MKSMVPDVEVFRLFKTVWNALLLFYKNIVLLSQIHLKCLICNSVCFTKDPGQIVCVQRYMLQPSGIFMFEVGLRLMDGKILPHCTSVE